MELMQRRVGYGSMEPLSTSAASELLGETSVYLGDCLKSSHLPSIEWTRSLDVKKRSRYFFCLKSRSVFPVLSGDEVVIVVVHKIFNKAYYACHSVCQLRQVERDFAYFQKELFVGVVRDNKKPLLVL